MTLNDLLRAIPVGLCSAGAHAASVFALGGDPLFGQIVKSGEPVFSAVVATLVYGNPPTLYQAACLPIIVGGVAFASLKPSAVGEVASASIIPGYALEFNETALFYGALANLFAGFKGGENKRLMGDTQTGLKERIGGVGNQFAVTQLISCVASLPVMWYTNGDELGNFAALCARDPSVGVNVALSGLCFYVYDELATMTVKATSPVTSSVANTAKRVIVVLYMAAVTGKALTHEQEVGAAIAIGGVFLYSIVNEIAGGSGKKEKKA